MSRTMYDSVTATDIPISATMVAGYINGRYAWKPSDWARFPGAVKVQISITAAADAGQVLDVETGDATPQQAPHWVTMRRAAGTEPTVYMNESTWASVKQAFAGQHVAPPCYWVAAYATPPAPSIPLGAVAHQYADPVHSGGHYDLSIVADHWPGVDPAPVPPPTPAPPIIIPEDEMFWLISAPNMGTSIVFDTGPTARVSDANSIPALKAAKNCYGLTTIDAGTFANIVASRAGTPPTS